MPNLISKANYGQINQGYIFSNARSFLYPEKNCFGVIITARCDIANRKTGVYNYIPIVGIDCWMEQDFIDIFYSRNVNNINGAIIDSFKNCGFEFGKEALDVYGAESLFATKIVKGRDLSLLNKSEKKVKENIDQIKSLNELVKNRGYKDNYIIKKKTSETKKIIDDLQKNTLAGYYFLKDVFPENENNGYVMNLRELGILPSELAVQLPRGVSEEDYKYLSVSNGWDGCLLDYSSDDFAYITGQISSPFIEHLLQCVNNLFGRIGVNDPTFCLFDLVFKEV